MSIGTGNGLTLVDQLDELIDVVLTAPTSGQSLIFDGVNQRWINASAAGGGGGSGTVNSVSAGTGLSATPNPITDTGEIFLTDTAVSAGDYTLASITVDAQGRITAASNGAAGAGTVTSVSAGVGLSASPNPITGTGEIFLTNTAVSAGAYTRANITVDAQGRITTAANGALQTITLTGDVSGSGTGSFTTTINPATVTNAKLANMNAFTIKSNIQSSAAVPTDNTLSVLLDTAVSGAAQGDILYRGNGSWTKLVAGTSGQYLRTLGVSANPVWADVGAGTGTVTSVSAGGGLTASSNPITTTGDISIANTTVSAGSYTYASLTVNARGQITTAGNGTNPVTSIAVSGKNGITVAGSPITSTGTIDLGLGAITPSSVTTGVVSASTLNVTGDVQAATGRVLASAATISGLLTGATATFSGIVSADAGLRATTVSASGVIGGSNLSGTNTGDQTITLTGDVSGTGTGSFAATINPATVTNAKLANMNAFTIKSNVKSSAASPLDNTLSTVIDAAVSGAAHGDILYRANGTWSKLVAGTSGQYLQTQGVSADPRWATAAGGGTVTSVSAGGGLAASTNPITTTGDLSIANTAVSAGTYTYPTITVNTRGQLTAASNAVTPITSAASIMRIFTSAGSHTWTKPTDTKFSGAKVWVVGAGGGGGGSGTTNSRIGGGGGGGGAAFRQVLLATLSASSVTVTVGSAGIGGAAGNNDGVAGGTSSFGAFITCTPGAGGQDGASGASSNAAGGIATGGDYNYTGMRGEQDGLYTDVYRGWGGAAGGQFGTPSQFTDFGGASTMISPGGIIGQWAGRGAFRPPEYAAVDVSGGDGAHFGGGGSGGQRATVNAKGGNGAPGVVVVIEEYS